MNNYVQDGDVIEFTAAADVVAGQVVPIGNILGVAVAAVASGAKGMANITGVYTCTKASGAVIAQGESLTWDVSAGNFDDNAATPATGDITGAPAFAFEAAGNGVTSFKVCFTGVPGTKT